MGVLMSQWLKSSTMPQSARLCLKVNCRQDYCKNENNPNGSPHVTMAKVLDYASKLIVVKIMQK